MQYVPFAGTTEKLSRICFGAMGLNCAFGTYDRSFLIRSVHHSLECGINFFDTARIYKDSEEILGEALRAWPGKQPFVASKIEALDCPANSGWGIPNPIDVAYPKGQVRRSTETSLRKLGLDTIDLMQLHQYWPQYRAEGHWLDELQELKAEGKIRHIGISATDHRHDGAIAIVESGVIDSVQTIINIFDPLALDALVPICQKNQVAVMARCVLDEGGLAGLLTADADFPATDFRAGYFSHGPMDEYVRRVEALRAFVPQYADSLAQLAIKFVLHHPGVSCANISLQVPEHADENLRVLEQPPLPDAIFEEIRRHHRWLHNLYEPKYFPPADDDTVAQETCP